MSLTRREVLASLLGLPALTMLPAACCQRPVPAGEIVGADVALGHLLRSPVERQPASTEHVDVLIVGAGIAGLSAGWRLAADPTVRFQIMELESEPGGTARWGRNAITSYPWAAHYVPVPSRNNKLLIRLLKGMGAIELDSEGQPHGVEGQLVAEPEERVFFNGEWHEGLVAKSSLTPDDRRQFGRFHKLIDHWVGWRDGKGRRAFAVPMHTGSDDAEVTQLDKLSMSAWMDEHGLTSPRLRWYVDLACRDDYGCSLENTSAWAGIFYFAARMPHPGAESAKFLTWNEGNGRIVEHLRNGLAQHLHTGQLVSDIIPHEHHVEAITVSAAARVARRIVADRVIVAVPRFIACQLLKPWRQAPPPDAQEFETSPWLVANITVRERPPGKGFGPAWDNVLYDSPSLGYVLATHQQGRSFGPTVLTYYYALVDSDPRRAREKLYRATREEWVEAILIDLQRAHPEIRSIVERVDVYRWGHAMVRPRPGFVWSEVRRKAAQPAFGRVHFAATDLSAVALLEEAQYHGVRAAEEVLAARGEVRSWI